MPDWRKALGDIARSVEAAANEAKARQQGRIDAARQSLRLDRCLYWDCQVPVPSGHIFCHQHFQDLQDGLIDECPGCGRAKATQYQACLECHRRNPGPPRGRQPSYKWYKPEYSPAWEKGDAHASEFFVYILKLRGGQFYAGQTRELRERLSEHRDGRVQSTRGQDPKLVWFGTLPTREAATAVEVELKKLVDSNPRQVRRMVLKFKDLAQELDYT